MLFNVVCSQKIQIQNAILYVVCEYIYIYIYIDIYIYTHTHTYFLLTVCMLLAPLLMSISDQGTGMEFQSPLGPPSGGFGKGLGGIWNEFGVKFDCSLVNY